MRTVFTIVGIFRKEVYPNAGPTQVFHSRIKLKTELSPEEVTRIGSAGLEALANKEALRFTRRDKWNKVWMTDWELESGMVQEEQVA
jgi:hypothetical protein